MQALRTTGAASDILWSMATGVIESVRDPELIDPGLLDSVMTLLRRAEYLGLLEPDAEHRPDESWSWLPAVVAGMTERGLPGRRQVAAAGPHRRLAATHPRGHRQPRWRHVERSWGECYPARWSRSTTNSRCPHSPTVSGRR